MPALPGTGEVQVQASSELGKWQTTGERECAFEYVRPLTSDDGVDEGALDVSGVTTVDCAGASDGSLAIICGTGFGQMTAISECALSVTTLDGPLLWLPATSD